MARTRKVVVEGEQHRPDYLILVLVVALLTIGLIMVFSTTLGLGYEEHHQPYRYFIRQLMATVIGGVLLWFMMRTEYHAWQRWSVPLMGVTLLMLVGVLFTPRIHGAQRWFLEGSIQPSELAKLVVVIYIANWLASKGDRVRQVSYGLVPFGLLIGVVAGLILLQPDASTALLIALTAGTMFFIAGAEVGQLIILLVAGGLALVGVVITSGYRLARVMLFLRDPLADPQISYQTAQALIALGSGGINGLGLGDSRQKFGYIPAFHTDAIFAILGEELGLIGCLVVLLLFLALAHRGLRAAVQAADTFGTLLATGLMAWLVFQALINMAVVTATVPFAGIPLPFISYGGSSMVASLAAVGLLLSVSRRTRQANEAHDASFDFRWGNRRPRLSGSGRRQVVDRP